MSGYSKKGVDISWCQPQVNWSNVDVDFVIVQVGGGYVAKKEDTMYQSHYSNAKAKGIPVGAYWFLQALNEQDAIEEANICISLIKGKQFEYPIFLDIEKDSQFQLGKQKFSALIRAFLQKVEAAGYWVGLYTNLSGLTYYIEDDIKTRYSIWIAQWDVSKPTYSGAYGIWQTGVGTFSGFPDKVDADICYVDYPTQIKAKGLNGYSNSNPDQPKVTPIEEFTPRLTIPESGNKYYNTPSVGGYAVGAILGNPLQNGLNILSNCVGFAAARFNEIINKDKWIFLTYPPNAEDFISKAKSEGLEILNKPEIGSIIVWAKGQVGNSSDGAGHVAVVEAVNEDGSIVTSESGYGCSPAFWTSKRYNSDGNWGAGNTYRFLGFIKNPAIDSNTKVKETNTDNDTKPTTKNPYKEPTVLIKEGSEGEGVKWLQWYLTEYGYFNDPISGKFDIITYGALLAYQSKNGLTVDGICGPSTRNSLKSKEK